LQIIFLKFVMGQKLLKYIVIFLGVLIFILFIATIYGFYLKLGGNYNKNNFDISLDLKEGHYIHDFEIIDEQHILVTINKDIEINHTEKYAILYDIKKNKIIRLITK
tara:strand:- start:26843 stop:27163 length:321 start_codon:yes stop_codon:yes gene_type:complete